MLIVISGPSGSGKGTIIKEVIKKISDLIYSVSYTTRPKREGEIEGKDYFFISEDEFEKLIDEDFFIEWAKVYDYYYGTSKEFVIENLRDGKDVILEIEIQGAKKIREIYDKKNAVFIFIAPPDFKELERRIMNRKRGETEEEIKKRMDFAKKEIEESKNYDYIIINDNINKAVKKIVNIINKERRKIYDSRFW